MSKIFSKENIFIIEEKLNSKEYFFKLIAKKAKELDFIADEKACFEGILYRENQSTTGFEDGFAIPHCKDATVKSAKLLLFKTPEIAWDSLDGKPITISHCLLMPENANNDHIKLLSKVARALIDENYRKAIKEASVEEIYQLVANKMEM
ncbi:MAG: fructose PTS transporter subunit IIA [Alphaproteobacteria bacterium]|jgi:fructose-specific phosphotransferase system IIA component|nr:fructose PTS transporter subunit IIA [Alphaproteobacteria bacterium]